MSTGLQSASRWRLNATPFYDIYMFQMQLLEVNESLLHLTSRVSVRKYVTETLEQPSQMHSLK